MKNNWFANHYDRIMRPFENGSFLKIRTHLIANASGDVLEIGCGTGINFSFYRNVTVMAIEPNETMRERAHQKAATAHVPIHVIEGSAETLPFEDHCFDTVVGTLVFCTIPDPEKAIREMKRVCKPNGKILLFEHIRHDNGMVAALQDALTPIWRRVCDGCRLNRDTVERIKHEGIEIVRTETFLNRFFVTIEGRNL